MSLIQVQNLSFQYEGSPELIFDNVSFQIDTDWKLGFIGRNGRGKTTFLRLLAGQLPYQGTIDASVRFDLFPYEIKSPQWTALRVARAAIAPYDAWEAEMESCLANKDEASLSRYGDLLELMMTNDGYEIDELIEREVGRLEMDPSALARPYETLSNGERTKLMIAALFLRKNSFLLIDEPTNHLDMEGRRALEKYLTSKKGFILVSHDRTLLDGVVDHVLSINRANIEVQRGNYQSWRQNRTMQDQYEQALNDSLQKEIRRLDAAMQRNVTWSDRIEATKIGGHVYDRGAVGAQSARMMKKAKAVENRIQRNIDEKQGLLKNVEAAGALKLHPLPYHKQVLIEAIDVQVDYGQGPLFSPVSFTVRQGARVAILGPNGAGKTSLLRLMTGGDAPHTGLLRVGNRMVVSYVPQDTGHLRGLPKDYAIAQGGDVTLFLTLLRKLNFDRNAFERPMEAYSEGQKKKVLLAMSLATPAHLYVWDEPMNYIDVLSREQLEALLCETSATMVFVEHDRSFVEAVATEEIVLKRP